MDKWSSLCAKLFMKDSLDKVEYAPRRLRAFIDLIRPFTLLAPVLGGLSGSFMGLIVEDHLALPEISLYPPSFIWHDLPFFRMLSGIVALVFLNAASNSLNQVYDLEIDLVNKSYRPIPSGAITKKEGLWIAIILYSIAIWRAALVNRVFLVIVCVLILITIAYSVPPFRFKKRLWISNISIAVPRGLLGMVAAWGITANISNPTPWVVGSIIAIFLTGSTTTKDFTDIKGDRMFGMRTLPIIYGKKMSIVLSSPFLIFPFILLTAYWYFDLLPDISILMVIVFLPWSAMLIYLLAKEGDKEDAHFENSPAWKHMYLMLMALQISFLAVFAV